MTDFPASAGLDMYYLKTRLGQVLGKDARRYWDGIRKFILAKIAKTELDEEARTLLGDENVPLHNAFVCAVLHSALHGLSDVEVVPLREEREKHRLSAALASYTEHDPARPLYGARSSVPGEAQSDADVPSSKRRRAGKHAGDAAHAGKSGAGGSSSRGGAQGTSSAAKPSTSHADYPGTPSFVSHPPKFVVPQGGTLGWRMAHATLPPPYLKSDGPKLSSELPDLNKLKVQMNSIAQHDQLRGVSDEAVLTMYLGMQSYIKNVIQATAAVAAACPDDSRTAQWVSGERPFRRLTIGDLRVATELSPEVLGEDAPERKLHIDSAL